MDFASLRSHVLFETGHDAEDLGDFLPHLDAYLNEGYDRLVMAHAGVHVSADSRSYPPLCHDRSLPRLPHWAHRAIADWAVWLIYRNGSAQKQNRGYVFRQSFEAAERRLRTESAQRYITHIPR